MGLLETGSEAPAVEEVSGAAPAEAPVDPGVTPTELADWRGTLPEDLRGDPALSSIQDIAGLAKSYVSAQRMVGADKIAVPTKHASKEDWRGVYHKLGLPEQFEEYSLNTPEGSNYDESFINGLRETAYKAGVLPEQLQALFEWYDGASKGLVEETEKSQEVVLTEAQRQLDMMYGAAKDQKLNLARQVVEANMGDEYQDFMDLADASGMGNHPKFIDFLVKVGEKHYAEGAVHGNGAGGFAKTPDELNQEINSYLNDPENPYYNKLHPNHSAAVQHVQSLMSKVYAEEEPLTSPR